MPKKSTNIYKRKDGRWEARYVKAIGADGRKKYGSVYAHSYQEVRDKQLSMMRRVQPSPRHRGKLTLEQLMLQWLESASNSIKPSTHQKYESLIRNHLSDGIGKTRADSVTGCMLDRFSAQKLETLSARTVNDILTLVGLAYRYAAEEFGLSTPVIRHIKVPPKEMRVLSREEQKILETFLITDMDQYKFGVFLALYTGLRLGELCALQWEDVLQDRIRVTKTLHRIKCGSGTKVEITSPKTASSNRAVPILPQLQGLIDRFSGSGYVLQTDSGKAVEPRLLQLKFEKYMRQCGLEKANFHALRHTFATRCIEAGFDVKSLSEILGHTDVKTTLNRYVHSSFALKQQNMQKLSLQVQL